MWAGLVRVWAGEGWHGKEQSVEITSGEDVGFVLVVGASLCVVCGGCSVALCAFTCEHLEPEDTGSFCHHSKVFELGVWRGIGGCHGFLVLGVVGVVACCCGPSSAISFQASSTAAPAPISRPDDVTPEQSSGSSSSSLQVCARYSVLIILESLCNVAFVSCLYPCSLL